MRRIFRRVVWLCVGLLLLGNLSIRAAAAETYDIDTAFRPIQDGFQFENYGNLICKDDHCDTAVPVHNLTPVEMVRLFGDRVCKKINPDQSCELYKIAETWMDEVNHSMQAGHCEGMAVLTSLFYAGVLDPKEFGSSSVQQLSLRNNVALQREIAFWYATQLYTDDFSIEQDPISQLKYLIVAYKNDPRLLIPIGIYKEGFTGGHTVTSYAIKAMKNHVYWIMVYDNNYPNEERHISVDVSDNSWQYVTKMLNDATETVYSGKGDQNPFQLTPVIERLGIYDCDFCPVEQTAQADSDEEIELGEVPKLISGTTNRITVDSNINLYIEDENGKRSGFDWKNDTSYDEIPDLNLYRSLGQSSVRLPTATPYYLWLNRPDSRDWATFDVSITSPGTVLSLGNVLESYEFPNIIYKPFSTENQLELPFETFEVVAYPNHIPTVEFVINNRYGECKFDLGIHFNGDADLSSKIDLLIYHDYEFGQMGIEIYAAKDTDSARFNDASFTVTGDFTLYTDEGEKKLDTQGVFPLNMKVNGSFYVDYLSWQKAGEFSVSGDMDGDLVFETDKTLK